MYKDISQDITPWGLNCSVTAKADYKGGKKDKEKERQEQNFVLGLSGYGYFNLKIAMETNTEDVTVSSIKLQAFFSCLPSVLISSIHTSYCRIFIGKLMSIQLVAFTKHEGPSLWS
jgi:hypothetical protein